MSRRLKRGAVQGGCFCCLLYSRDFVRDDLHVLASALIALMGPALALGARALRGGKHGAVRGGRRRPVL
jgi:hypothetical protein